MRRHRNTALSTTLALMVAIGTPSFAANRDGDAPAKPVPEALRPAVSEAEAWGTRIYLHDRAAWLATDAMFESRRGEALKPRLGGWVTEDTTDGVRVIFVSKGATPVRLYEQEMRRDERLGKGVFESPEPLTAEHLAQIRARATAGATDFEPACAQRYNAVTLRDGDGWRVYLMPGFSQQGVIPYGGYHLVKVTATGTEVVAQRAFSRGCLDIDDGSKDEGRGRPVFSMVTHVLDPTPTEVHVFTSFHMRVPTMVMTSGAGDDPVNWIVSRGAISYQGTLGNAPRGD
jgi:hypothetical protein